ncbi:MAG: DNA polymerase IV [Parvibaculales bacterium]
MVSSTPHSPSRLCRDCMHLFATAHTRCPVCKSPRLITHEELTSLSIAHMDCDAFFAAVEKRDNPDLEDKPLIIGGGKRGVVSTCCYIARIYGVSSAMPMFKALELCPQAVIMPPNGEKYQQVGQEIRAMMLDITPLVQPVSIDEAFLDLTGTERLHGEPPAARLARLAKDIKQKIGITVSIGLSHNKFLAKLASDMDKPNGYTIIGRAETSSYLAALPVNKLWGVGKQTQKKLARDGITNCQQLQKMEQADLIKRYGQFGLHLHRLAHGIDSRHITPTRQAKSISAETTFEMDTKDTAFLEKTLWKLCEKVSRRCKAKNLAGETVVLKLKTSDFKSLTRNRKLADPSQMADTLFAQGLDLLKRELSAHPQRAYRLIGIGYAGLTSENRADPYDLADPEKTKRHAAELAMDKVRDKFGSEKIKKGRGLSAKDT